MGIYQKIAELAGEQENRFLQKCDEAESHFAQVLLSLSVDLSTAERAKSSADKLEIKVTDCPAMLATFLDIASKRPRHLAKLAERTRLTVHNGSLMTAARAATLPVAAVEK